VTGSATRKTNRPSTQRAAFRWRFNHVASLPEHKRQEFRARRVQSGIQLSWVRRASGDGDSWALPDVPQPIVAEAYLVSMLNSVGTPLRTIEVQGSSYLYPAAEELADFGVIQTQISLSICQMGPAGRLGYRLEERISVQHNG
jgi:hypothetical protein